MGYLWLSIRNHCWWAQGVIEEAVTKQFRHLQQFQQKIERTKGGYSLHTACWSGAKASLSLRRKCAPKGQAPRKKCTHGLLQPRPRFVSGSTPSRPTEWR
mmetsp:Transcript_125467/g.354934  ORF Transcript_125467/g.354934 Transcript_125467/m.354934 type:complete len:100 (+) Transcript_125467:67-366(+)